jgi:alkaline phosphatase D
VGDQIYSDFVRPISVRRLISRRDQPPSRSVLQAHYRRLYRGHFNQAGFRALQETLPTFLSWDDHEIVDAWGARPGPDARERPLFTAATAAYREYQHLRNPGATLASAVPFAYHFWYGDTGFFVLDTRGLRDYRRQTLLGPGQFRALGRFLAEAATRAIPTVFVVAAVPIIHFSPLLMDLLVRFPNPRRTAARDRWTAPPFRAQRDALLESLLDWQSAQPERRVFLLSGDVHAGAAFRVTRRDRPGALWQWTSSPLTSRSGRAAHLANLLGTALPSLGEPRYAVRRHALTLRQNFGLVRVTPRPTGGHSVYFTLHTYRPGEPNLAVAADLTADIHPRA